MKVTYIMALVYLAIGGVQDIRTRTVPHRYLLAGMLLAAAAVGVQGYREGTAVIANLFAAVPGVLLLALSWITRGEIGVGDGICVAIAGLLIGTPMIYLMLMLSLLFSSICAAGLLVTRRGTRHSRMPWLPFLAAGLAVSMWIWGGAV